MAGLNDSLPLAVLLNQTVPQDGPPPPSKATIQALTISFMTASSLCTLFRFYTRMFLVKSFGWDDVFVSLASAMTVTGSIALLIGADNGLGRHYLELTRPMFLTYLKAYYITAASYVTSTALIKISLLLQYSRIFPARSPLRQLCIGLLIFTALWGIAYTVLVWVPCAPGIRAWHISGAKRKCFAYGTADVGTYVSHAAINTLLDLMVLALLLPLSWHGSEVGKRKVKRRWLILLLVGGQVNCISIWRLIEIVRHKVATAPFYDPTWFGAKPCLLAALELDLSNICASVPIFWPVIEPVFHSGSSIFVTHEVEIEEERVSVKDRKRGSDGFLKDEAWKTGPGVELTQTRVNAGSREGISCLDLGGLGEDVNVVIRDERAGFALEDKMRPSKIQRRSLSEGGIFGKVRAGGTNQPLKRLSRTRNRSKPVYRAFLTTSEPDESLIAGPCNPTSSQTPLRPTGTVMPGVESPAQGQGKSPELEGKKQRMSGWLNWGTSK